MKNTSKLKKLWNIKLSVNYFTGTLIFCAVALSCTYLFLRTFFIIIDSTVWHETLLATIFLFAELFGFIHSINYLLILRKVHVKESEQRVFADNDNLSLETYPPIAIVVPSYHEPLSVLRNTLLCLYNLSYPNKNLYLLDDSPYDTPWDTPEKIQKYREDLNELCQWIGVNIFRRKWRGAKAGIINDFLQFRNGAQFEKMEFLNYQTASSDKPEKYIAIFDADMNPLPDFLEPLVPLMEKDEKIAFVQTPQYYTNFENNRVAKAAGLQQVIFFEYICEGKDLKNAVFCCGSNVLFRIEALHSTGGFDESSITEDFATSLKLHLEGWSSVYYPKVSAFGKGPEDLRAYFKQQFRWAQGTIQLAKQLPKHMLSNYKRLPLAIWWEYIISSTYYFTGCFFFVMMLFPILFIFFDTPPLFIEPAIYVAILVPYLALSFYLAVWTLYQRNYHPYNILSSIIISAISFYVYIKAAFCALIGKKARFEVTPKEKCAPLPLHDLWPQLSIMLLCVAALAWGANRLYYENTYFGGILGNMLWCAYNLIVMSFVLYFNNPEGKSLSKAFSTKKAS